MQILILMLQTIRQHSNHGGSSKIVKDVAGHLARSGHSVTILCSYATDNTSEFVLAPGVIVRPTLRYRQSWQDTLLVPPYHLASIIQVVRAEALAADRVVIFDSHFLYADAIPTDVPTVWSLRDFVYVQALQGSFTFRRDEMIVPSQYTGACFLHAAGGMLPGLSERIHVIPNGVDLSYFGPIDAASLRRRIGVSPDAGPILLFPHRPEDAKGMTESLQLTKGLIDNGLRTTKLVILRGSDSTIMDAVRDYYTELSDRVASLGLTDAVIMVDWLPQTDMPSLYSLATVTLCVGDIVETCSNTALESLAVGTPVLACGIACYKEFPEYITKVEVGNVPEMVRIVADLAKDGAKLEVDTIRADLATGYGFDAMLTAYCRLIENARVRPVLPFAPRSSSTTVRIPQWVSWQGKSLYNEYSKCRLEAGPLDELWAKYGHQPVDPSDVPGSQVADRLLTDGYLVPWPVAT